MSATVTPLSTPAVGAPKTPKEQFLDSYEREHEKTMRVLRAFPTDPGALRVSPKGNSARDIAWIFTLERGLGKKVMNNEFATQGPSGPMPKAPESWDAIVEGAEQSHREFGELVRSMPDEKLYETVRFFTGPKQMSDIPRIDFLWFLLFDEIHHRGQLSVYLRMADCKVPSIYGPSEDEPWM